MRDVLEEVETMVVCRMATYEPGEAAGSQADLTICFLPRAVWWEEV